MTWNRVAVFGPVTLRHEYANTYTVLYQTDAHTEPLARLDAGAGFAYLRRLEGDPAFTQADYELLLQYAEDHVASEFGNVIPANEYGLSQQVESVLREKSYEQR